MTTYHIEKIGKLPIRAGPFPAIFMSRMSQEFSSIFNGWQRLSAGPCDMLATYLDCLLRL
jgi:hypothetical protein